MSIKIRGQNNPLFNGNQINKILVPVDGSECSYEAVNLAVDLAQKYNSKICLVYVIPTSVWNYCLMTVDGNLIPVCTMKEMEDEGERLLLSVLNSVRECDVEAYAKIDYGRPSNRIVQIAREKSFSLIVIGSNSRSLITRLFFGSVSDEVVHKAPCSVLLVKKTKE